MSATDQAFIRAYGAPVKSGVKPTPVRPPRADFGPSANSPVVADASATKTWIARAEVALSESTTLQVAAEGAPVIPATRIACIDVGIGTVIPAPHVSFGQPRSPAVSATFAPTENK